MVLGFFLVFLLGMDIVVDIELILGVAQMVGMWVGVSVGPCCGGDVLHQIGHVF